MESPWNEKGNMFGLLRVSAILVIVSGTTPRPGFISTFATSSEDFLYNVLETHSGYLCLGTVGGSPRRITLDPEGSPVADSMLSCTSINLCIGQDSCLTTAFTIPGYLCIRSESTSGALIWQRQFSEFDGYQVSQIVSDSESGYYISCVSTGAGGTLLICLDLAGIPEWSISLPWSIITSLTYMENLGICLSALESDGSVLSGYSPAGDLLFQWDFPDLLVRDAAFRNGCFALAAVESGTILLDQWGNPLWTALNGEGREIYSLVFTSSGGLIAAGSRYFGPFTRSCLAGVSSDGSIEWENSYGWGDSFRSISLEACSDGGLVSAGGYQEDGTLNSFVIRTDSLGSIQPQGVTDPGEVLPVVSAFNPQQGSSVRISFSGVTGRFYLNLIDLAGRTVAAVDQNADVCPGWVDLPVPVPGTYLYVLKGQGSTLSGRVIVLR